MTSHFIKKISVKNFKCFKELKIDNIKRVNLIGGKNNIGKTALMEGIKLFASSNNSIDLANNIGVMLARRQLSINADKKLEIDFIYKNSSKKSNIEFTVNDNKSTIEYIDETSDLAEDKEPSLRLKVKKDNKVFSINRLIDRYYRIYDNYFRHRNNDRDDAENTNFISSTIIDENSIAELYGELMLINKEEFLNNSLKLFDENIILFKPIPVKGGKISLNIQLKNIVMPVLLSSLGEGVNRYVAVLCAIWANQNGFLFIDEIENGIHYKNYAKFWQIIFEESEQANTQIFATTHSKECIEAFNEYHNDKSSNYFELYKNEKINLIEAKQRNKKQLEYVLTHSGEIRGE